MAKVKSSRNKTIDTTVEQGREYLARCISVNTEQTVETLIDKTIIGDTFDVMPLLPHNAVDLVITDPPYNLTKSFNGTTFSKKTVTDYEDYTRQWLSLVYPLLKDDGSIYVCCDWETSLIVGRVLGEFFTIRNRITWQREKGRGASANWKNGMEDIWFATKSNQYTFNLDAVKIRKRLSHLTRLMANLRIGTKLKTATIAILVPLIFGTILPFRFGLCPKTLLTPHKSPKS